jgi:hypothetical protein
VQPEHQGLRHDLLWAAHNAVRNEGLAYTIVHAYEDEIEAALPRLLSWRSKAQYVSYVYRSRHPLDVDRWQTAPIDGDNAVT